ncbi:MAG: rod shape-determining protein MreD [Spirochaetales bacterium]
MKRIIIFALLILGVLLVETAILSNWYILPVVPDLLLIILVYISVHNGCVTGEVFGFSSGMAIDFLTGSPFGLNALIRSIIGFLGGILHFNINTKGIIMPMLFGAVATLLKAFIIFITSFFYPTGIITYSLFSSHLWYECLFNALLSPPIFWILSLFTVLSFSYTKENYT